jgi:hypothetical protein
MQTETMKLSLIRQIMETNDTAELKKIDSAIKKIQSEDNSFQHLVKPTRRRLDIEAIKKEQNYLPVDKKVLHQKIRELDLKEPIEQLLAMI